MKANRKPVQSVDAVTIRFAGDSGDGMQLTGIEFTRATARAGNDLQTFRDFPAEIRAPTGTLAGISGFQIQFSSQPVFTPGDALDALVVMNPAALQSNLKDVKPGGILVINTGTFSDSNLKKAGYEKNPLADGTLTPFQTHHIDITKLTRLSLQGLGLNTREMSRAKNMFALGVMLWMYGRPTEATLHYLKEKFEAHPHILAGNEKALKAGYNYGETAEMCAGSYYVKAAALTPGTYRNVTGNDALAWGMLAAVKLSGLNGFFGSYPITPASDILHEVSRHKNWGLSCFQAEDEMAAICAAIGAAFGGALAFTSSSGPGIALKQEAVALACMVELPLVIINVQRAGPSTGMPTKTEQADLLQALYGRNGEAPVPVLAAMSPSDCFETTLEAARLAVKYMTPVFLLSDSAIANGQEPWRLPDVAALAPIDVKFRKNPADYFVYRRHEETLARDWVRPGTPGLQHCIGGLEKDKLTGAVSYDAENHEAMVRLRAQKVLRIAQDMPPAQVQGAFEGTVLVVGWGSTYGAIRTAVNQLQQQGKAVSHLHLKHLNPLPVNLRDVVRHFQTVLVPELNLGQLLHLLRTHCLVDAKGIHKVQGKPFGVPELVARIQEYC